jgi:hypothetical protein
LEDTLLAFADSPELRRFAPLAFHRLNTHEVWPPWLKLLRKVEISSYLADAAKLGCDKTLPTLVALLGSSG